MYLGYAHYAYFFLTLFGLILAVRFMPGIVPRVEAATSVLGRRAFHSTIAELPKFVLLRIAIGIIITWRAWDIIVLLTPGDYQDPWVIFAAFGNIIAGLLLVIGFATQYVFIFLMLIQWQQSDWLLGTSTLGNDVGAIVSLMLMLTNAGRYYSLDSILLRPFPRLRPWLLYFNAAPTASTINSAKLIALFSYWLVCMYSLSMHINEPAWMSGVAGPQLLTNNYMSTLYAPMMELFQRSDLVVHIGRIALWMMLPWYLLVFPATLLGGAARHYVIIWGILFFILSKFVLQLGWLAEMEWLLWIGLFWSRTGILDAQRFAVAYDDTCNLCDRTVQFVRLVDLFDRVCLRPANQNKEWLAQHGISYERAMQDLHGIDTKTGRIDAGYDFYIALSRYIVLLWILYPFLVLGKWLLIGPVIYRWIAKRRTAIFGVCRMPSPKPAPRMYVQSADTWQRRWVAVATLHVFLCGFFYFLAIPAPYLDREGWSSKMGDNAHAYGIAPIIVFNNTDLRMMENWFTIHALEGDKEVIVPVFREDGTRLAYHRSDRIYFGGTLVWRRVTIPYTDCRFEDRRGIVEYLASVYLDQNDRPPGQYRFRFTQYHEPIADPEILKQNHYVRGERSVRCTVDFSIAHPAKTLEIVVPFWKKG